MKNILKRALIIGFIIVFASSQTNVFAEVVTLEKFEKNELKLSPQKSCA